MDQEGKREGEVENRHCEEWQHEFTTTFRSNDNTEDSVQGENLEFLVNSACAFV